MKIFSLLKNQKGIGLPEVSMGIAILSILLSAITGALNSSFDIFNYHEKNIYEQTQSNIILGRLSISLKNCVVLESPLQKDAGGTPTDVLSGSFFDPSQSYTTVKRKSYQVINKTLVEKDIDSNTAKILSEPCIESLTFLRDTKDARVIYLNLIIRDPNSKSKITNDFKVKKIMFADNVEAKVNG